MAIQLVGVQTHHLTINSYTGLDITTLTGGIGSAPAAGDLVDVSIYGGSNADRVLAATGYNTVLQLRSNDTNDANHYRGWKIMGSTPDTTIDVTAGTPHAGGAMVVRVVVLRGVDPTNTLDVGAANSAGANSGIPTFNPITPSTPGAWICASANNAHTLGNTDTFSSSAFDSTASASEDAANYDTTWFFGVKEWTSGAFDAAALSFSAADSNTYSWVASQVAYKPALSGGISGTGAGTAPLGGSGAGTVPDAGAGAGDLPLGGSGAGAVPDDGAGAGDIGLGGGGAGTVPAEGTGAGDLPLGGSGTGGAATGVSGSGAGDIPLGGSGAGAVPDDGAGAGDIGLGGSGAGTVPNDGSGAGDLPLGGSGTGGAATGVSGAGAGDIPLGGSGAGAVPDDGAGAGDIGLGGSGAGTVPAEGTGAGDLPLGGSGTGTTPASAAGAGDLPLGGAGAGTVADPPTIVRGLFPSRRPPGGAVLSPAIGGRVLNRPIKGRILGG